MSTSDNLKKVFAQYSGGSEKDWKRLSKKNNAEGQPVRVFENKKTGVKLEVVELGDGQFKARRLSDDAEPQDAQALVRAPVIETDATQNDAADQVIRLLEDDYDELYDQAGKDLIAKAGKAMANRFCFAIGGGEDDAVQDGLYVEFSPIGINYTQHLEHVISHLLPDNCGEDMELTFNFSNYTDPVRLVSDLMKHGFVWDREYQRTMDAQTGTPHFAALSKAFPVPATDKKSDHKI